MGCRMWIDLLYDMEFQSSSGANLRNTLKGRPNILFGEISHSHDDFWTATEYVPPGCSGESVVKDFLKWDDLAPIGEITVLCHLHKVFSGALRQKQKNLVKDVTTRLTKRPPSFRSHKDMTMCDTRVILLWRRIWWLDVCHETPHSISWSQGPNSSH